MAGKTRSTATSLLEVQSTALAPELAVATNTAGARGLSRGSGAGGRDRGGGRAHAGGEGRGGGRDGRDGSGCSRSRSRRSRGNAGSRGSAGGRGSRGFLGGARGSARGTVPDGRAGDGVAVELAVDVEEDALVVGLVSTRDGDTLGQFLGARRGDFDLDTLHVELGTALAGALVQADELRTEQVFASGDVGDGHGVLALVLDEGLDGPGAISVAVLGDLDPAVASRAGLGGRHVDHDGALVGEVDDVVAGVAAVVVPLEGELVAASGLDVLGGCGGAADVAGHVLGSHVGDGGVAGGRTNVAVLAVAQALILVIDPGGHDGGVGGDESSARCQSEESESLHFEGIQESRI